MEQIFIPWKGWTAVRVLGQGGFGKVYEIQRSKGGITEKAAMKVITIPRDSSEVEYLEAAGYDEASITKRFDSYKESVLREYGIMATMKGNTNIVYCDDVEELRRESHGWNIYIKMELLTPLLKSMDAVKEEQQIIRLGRDLCGALIACQKQNIIHRDIKPQNVFVGPDGTFKLGDFGIARTLEHTTRATAGIGTYNYMAPEVLHKKAYNQTVDIYSLGLMLYWLLNARRGPFMPLPPAPMTHSAEEQSFQRRMSGEAIPAPMSGSAALKNIVLKACAFDPMQRYQTAEEMLRALNALSNGSTASQKQAFSGSETVFGATVVTDHQPASYRNVGVGRVEAVPRQPAYTQATVLDSQPYRNAGAGKVEQIKQPPKTAPQQPKAASQPPKAAPQQPKAAPQPPKAKPAPVKKKKKIGGWIAAILLLLCGLGGLLNAPELQEKLGIYLTIPKPGSQVVALSESSDSVYPNSRGPALRQVLEEGERERIYYADGSWMDMYYDELGQERIRIYCNGDGSVAFHFEAEYNEDGNMLVYRSYEEETLMETVKWHYNSNGNVESRRTTDRSGALKEYTTWLYEGEKLLRVEGKDASDAMTFVTGYSYSDDGMGCTVVRTDSDGSSSLWNYDEKDLCIEYRSFDSQGNQLSRTAYAYNAQGQKTEAVFYNAQEIEEYRTTYEYNQQGQVHRSVTTWPDGSTHETVCSYNSRGVETETKNTNTYLNYEGEKEVSRSTLQWAEDMQGTILRSVDKGSLGELWVCYNNVFGEEIKSVSYDYKGDFTYMRESVRDENGEFKEYRVTSYYEDGSMRITTENSNYEEISYVEYDADGNRVSRMEAIWDDCGRLSAQEVFRADGSRESYTSYKYLEDGTLEWITRTYFSDYDNSTTETMYDADWNPHYSHTMDETGITSETFYTYDALGEMESYKNIYYYSDGRYSVSMSNGDYNTLWEQTYNANDVLLDETAFDENGRSTRKTYYDANGNVTYWEEYVRDAQGNLDEIVRHE